jgi:hypothetical protein
MKMYPVWQIPSIDKLLVADLGGNHSPLSAMTSGRGLIYLSQVISLGRQFNTHNPNEWTMVCIDKTDRDKDDKEYTSRRNEDLYGRRYYLINFSTENNSYTGTCYEYSVREWLSVMQNRLALKIGSKIIDVTTKPDELLMIDIPQDIGIYDPHEKCPKVDMFAEILASNLPKWDQVGWIRRMEHRTGVSYRCACGVSFSGFTRDYYEVGPYRPSIACLHILTCHTHLVPQCELDKILTLPRQYCSDPAREYILGTPSGLDVSCPQPPFGDKVLLW